MQAEKELTAQIAGKAGFSHAGQEQWEQLTKQYPAFNLGYYFLTRSQLKAKSCPPEQLQSSRQAAALHFNDIRWLDYLLKSDTFSKPAADIATSKPAAATATQHQDIPAGSDVNNPEHQAHNPAESVAEKTVTENVAKVQETNLNDAGRTEAIAGAGAPAPENDRLTQLLSQQLADFKKPVARDARLGVDREPLYKTDYFASQGISVLKNRPADGLDKKVRKFTDWLKEMKQSPTRAGVPQLNTTPEEEAQAAEKAASSLKNEPILTESMAEVLVSQGKNDQARGVYQKLSLLYPEKSTYFASKIDLLQ